MTPQQKRRNQVSVCVLGFHYQFQHLQGVEDSEEAPKRTEFKVWSVILSCWSEVLVSNVGAWV